MRYFMIGALILTVATVGLAMQKNQRGFTGFSTWVASEPEYLAAYVSPPSKEQICKDLALKGVYVSPGQVKDLVCDRLGDKMTASFDVDEIVQVSSRPKLFNRRLHEHRKHRVKAQYELVGNTWNLKTIE